VANQVYVRETTVESARSVCREAANGFEGAFEALTNQATGFAGGILLFKLLLLDP